MCPLATTSCTHRCCLLLLWEPWRSAGRLMAWGAVTFSKSCDVVLAMSTVPDEAKRGCASGSGGVAEPVQHCRGQYSCAQVPYCSRHNVYAPSASWLRPDCGPNTLCRTLDQLKLMCCPVPPSFLQHCRACQESGAGQGEGTKAVRELPRMPAVAQPCCWSSPRHMR